MKRLFLILSIALISCSAEDVNKEPEVVDEKEYMIFVKDDCPDHTDLTGYYVSEETHTEITEYVATFDVYCVEISFEDLVGDTYSGYYGGERTSED